MRLSRRNLCCTAVLCSFFLLTSCSSHHKTAGQPSPLQGEAFKHSKAYALPADDEEEAESTLSEPEESAGEEIAELDRLGAWQSAGEPGSGTAIPSGYVLSDYDFPVLVNRQVSYYLDLFQGRQHDMFARWLARSARYMPVIEKELSAAGLPRELAYLAMIESGCNPSAVSRAGAGGLWQFMPATGRRYNLAINSWVDERREPAKATRAAVRYLDKLYRQFGDWHLAVAAYNTGEGKVEQAIRDGGTNNFWELAATDALYAETKRYVPKLIAAIIIARNPTAYGFDDIDYEASPSYEVVHVPGNTSLGAVAETTGAPLRHLRALNNELLRSQTPPRQKYALRVPVGSSKVVLANIDRLQRRPAPASTPRHAAAYATHVVKKGETLNAISRQYKIRMTELLQANRLRVSSLQVGQRLQIPVAASSVLLAKNRRQAGPARVAGIRPGARQSYHVKKGDTLHAIASRHGVSVEQLRKWNGLGQKNDLRIGQQLALYKGQGAAPAARGVTLALTGAAKTSASPAKPVAVQGWAKAAATQLATKIKAQQGSGTTKALVSQHKTAGKQAVAVTVASKTAVKQPVAGKKAAPKSWYVVQKGDSMQAIARKSGISVEQLKKWNKLSSSKIEVGNRLLVRKS